MISGDITFIISMAYKRIHFGIHLVLLLLAGDLFGSPQLNNDSILDITSDVYILEDKNFGLTFSDILQTENQAKFYRSYESIINFGISTSVIWIKFKVPAGSKYVQISTPNLHHATYYSQDSTGKFHEFKSGFLSSFSTRELSIDRFTFNITSGNWCYLRIQSGHFINTSVLTSSNLNPLVEKATNRMLFYGIYTGSMIIIAAYVLFFSIQERKFYLLLYFGYVVFISSINLLEKGVLHQYLWPDNPQINKIFPILPFGVSICLLFFINTLFNVRKIAYRFFQFVLVGVIGIPGIIVSVLLLLNRYHNAIIIAQLHSVTICFVFIYLLFLAHKKASRFKLHLLLLAMGILTFSTSVILYLFAENGVITMNFFSENSIVLGSFFEVIFSTSTIVLYQKSLKCRLHNLITHQNTILRKTVDDKTRELVSKNERLEEIILEKENLVSIIAHDLKSPLNQTKALSQLVQCEIGKRDHEAISLAKHIEKVSNHGLQLIKELFEVTTLEISKDKVAFTSINLRELSKEIIENFVPISQKKEIELQFNCSDEVVINSYPPYVIRIIENILSNAIKFSPPGGKVELSIHDLHSRAMVSIKDTGPGFREEDKKYMFRKFQKLSAKPTAGESSNGLGLYIIKTLASRLDALISVESEAGYGTLFSFSFPKS